MAAQYGRRNEGDGARLGRRAPPRTTGSRNPLTGFIDSHAHLADSAFDADRDAVLERATSAGARAVICIGESIAAATRAAEVAAVHPDLIFATAGIHPHEAASFDPLGDLAAIRRFVEHGAVAIGECGLDYHYNHSPPELQRRAFSAQLALARELARPVIVHTREAERDTRAMVVEAGAAGVRGVLHCYTGSHDLAEAALAAGWYVSFSGIVTFKNWTDDTLVRLVPDERLLVESDSPYLAPVPHRGRRNEPSWVSFTLARVAALRGSDAAALGELTATNTRRLFNLRLSS